LKICILYGGVSSEREVSLNTGESIYNAICNYYEVTMHDFNGNYGKFYDSVKDVDLVFNALHGGSGEDGTMQKYLESKNIKFTGSCSNASEKAMDKNISKLLCVKHNIFTPNWTMIERSSNSLSKIIEEIIYEATVDNNQKLLLDDFVVKPTHEGSSIGVSIVETFPDNHKDLEKALIDAFAISDSVMIESFIDGRELTVSILNDKVLPIVEIIPKGDYYDYKCKYTKFQSDYIVPAKIDKKTQELLSAYSLKIHKLIGCGEYSRVDFRLSVDGKIYFLEINTLPGFTDTSLFPKSAAAYGLGYKELIKKIIEIT